MLLLALSRKRIQSHDDNIKSYSSKESFGLCRFDAYYYRLCLTSLITFIFQALDLIDQFDASKEILIFTSSIIFKIMIVEIRRYVERTSSIHIQK